VLSSGNVEDLGLLQMGHFKEDGFYVKFLDCWTSRPASTGALYGEGLNCQLDCNQPSQGKAKSSQVKAKAGCKSATALPIHLLLSYSYSFFLILSYSLHL